MFQHEHCEETKSSITMKDDPVRMSKSEKNCLEGTAFQDPFLQTLSDYRDSNTRPRDAAAIHNTSGSKNPNVNPDLMTKASMTLPLKWDGDSLTVEKNIKTSIACGIPASVNNGQWSATFTGSSHVRGPMGCASGAMNLVYHPSILKGSQLHGGLQVGDQPSVTVGGLLRRGNKSTMGVSLVSNRRTSSLAATLSAQHKFDACLINSRVTLGPSSPSCNVSVAPSLKTHKAQLGVGWNRKQPVLSWNVSVAPSLKTHKAQLGIGWNRKQPVVSVMLSPKLSAHRRGVISIHWKPAGGWNVGAVLTQSLASKVASLGIGIRLCKKGLEWIFTWNRGDVTVRIPISITQYSNVWMNCLQVAYLSAVTQVIQDVIADLWNLSSSPEENAALRKEQERMKRDKARRDAQRQKQLMQRQAQIRAKTEQAKHGLVIRRAVYHVEGGDSWDVTTPLQFWTDNSSLELPPSSKKDLLGFYNVASRVLSDEDAREAPWLKQLWGHYDKAECKAPTPFLSVQYYFGDRLYEITISDEEQLVLPSSKAVPAAAE
jgi:hypothetical protein